MLPYWNLLSSTQSEKVCALSVTVIMGNSLSTSSRNTPPQQGTNYVSTIQLNALNSKPTNVLIVGSCFSGKSVLSNQISYLYNKDFSMNHLRDKISNEMCKIMHKCIHKTYPNYQRENGWDDVDIETDDNLENISDKLDTLPNGSKYMDHHNPTKTILLDIFRRNLGSNILYL